jgi:hypothetical protein
VISVFSDTGNGSNQTSWPWALRIIGPSWAGPNCGARKMSPPAAGARLRSTVIEGGSRPGWERKCCTPSEPAGTSGSLPGESSGATSAILKLNVPLLAPTMSSRVFTVTVSPGSNALAGKKLPPSPSESAAIVPLCAPLCEPTTLMLPICEAGIPRKAICCAGRL